MPRSSLSIRTAMVLVAFLFATSSQTHAQNLPKKIRGYKVHQTKVAVTTVAAASKKRKGVLVVLEFGKPVLSGVSLSGVTLRVDCGFTVFGQSGSVNLITFENFKVNGKRVVVRNYVEGFKFKNKQKIVLSKPLKISIGAVQSLKTAIFELTDSKEHWR